MTIAKEKTSLIRDGQGTGSAHRTQRQIWLGAHAWNTSLKPNSVMRGQPELSTMIFGCLGVNMAATWALR